MILRIRSEAYRPGSEHLVSRRCWNVQSNGDNVQSNGRRPWWPPPAARTSGHSETKLCTSRDLRFQPQRELLNPPCDGICMTTTTAHAHTPTYQPGTATRQQDNKCRGGAKRPQHQRRKAVARR